MLDAFIVDGIRTPIGTLGGSLSGVRADDLAAVVLRELLARNARIPADALDDVIFGCANQAGEDNRNVARMALLLAGVPFQVPGETVNRLCSSGMSAVIHGVRAIKSGDGDLYFTGGVEHMTRGPYVISKSSRAFGNDAQLFDSSFGWRFVNPAMEQSYGIDPMGITAENLADLHKISRVDQDLFSYRSHIKARKAQQGGRLAEEIVPVKVPVKKNEWSLFREDEFIKPDTTLEKLAQLKPVFRKEGGSVTAGNSSGLNDGAVAIVVASEKALKKYGLVPKARIVSSAVVGVEPRLMGIGPVKASQKALERAGLTLGQVDVIELNEAFAAQALACMRALGLEDDDPRLNPNGGAIALGHPLGMSGARIIHTAALELQKQNKRFALATLCVGVGQGYAVVIEKTE
jgi:3-oxoadipyl-CoA thiolase